MKKKILIATHNKAKLKELKQFLTPLLPTTEFVSLSDLHIIDEPEETGKTFLENAKLKAEYYAKLSNLPTLSDDGGLVIDSLNGEPGVHSNRWVGHRGTDQELIEYCLKRTRDIPKDKRQARFEACLYYVDPVTNKHLFEKGVIEGSISEKASKKVENGYPYRSVFRVARFGKFYTDLTADEHSQINHRLQALKRLAQRLKTWYN